MNPLLIFTGALHPKKAVFERFMHDFDAPCFIIAADSGLVCAEEFGYTPDLIVGDMDSLTDKSLLSGYPEDKIRIFDRDKAESDTVLALEEAFAKRSKLLSRSSDITMQTQKSGSTAGRLAAHNLRRRRRKNRPLARHCKTVRAHSFSRYMAVPRTGGVQPPPRFGRESRRFAA